MARNPPANAGDTREGSSVSGLGRSPGVGNGNLLQHSHLENYMDRGVRRAIVHGVTKSQVWLTDMTEQLSTHTHPQFVTVATRNKHIHQTLIEHLLGSGSGQGSWFIEHGNMLRDNEQINISAISLSNGGDSTYFIGLLGELITLIGNLLITECWLWAKHNYFI